jgi:hypothetical protein
MTMSSLNADGDETTVVAPQQRSPRVEQYLTMLTSLERVLDPRRELDVDYLLQLAQSRLGPVSLSAHSDLHIQGLRCLAESIRRDSYYDDIGRRMANYYVYNWIQRYIQFERDLAAFPDIFRVPVSKPLFLVGFGRTGSTFLHHLLARDPQARAPRLWELLQPSPPPRPETYDTDPRIRRLEMRLSSQSIMMPDFHKIHESDARAPEECNHMMWHGPQHIALGFRSSDYWRWFRNLSSSQLHVLYACYKLQVQHLQLFHRGGHWVSKSLTHAHFFPVLFQIFPDARIVRLHRDPCQIIPALASIMAHVQVPYAGRIDFHEHGQRMLNLFCESMHETMQIDKEVSSEHFIDVLFDDLTRDPIGTVRAIYSKFDYRYTAEFDSGIRRYSETDSINRKYKHVYTLEQFGLSRAQVMARSEEYLAWVEQRTGSKLCRS